VQSELVALCRLAAFDSQQLLCAFAFFKLVTQVGPEQGTADLLSSLVPEMQIDTVALGYLGEPPVPAS